MLHFTKLHLSIKFKDQLIVNSHMLPYDNEDKKLKLAIVAILISHRIKDILLNLGYLTYQSSNLILQDNDMR